MARASESSVDDEVPPTPASPTERAVRTEGHVVLVGDDGLGVQVLEELHALGVELTAVCAEAEAPFARAARGATVPLILDDPQSEATLKAAGVQDARACALLANGDLANLHVALELAELAPESDLILRLFNTSLAEPVRELVGQVTVLSATELACPAFVEAALRGSADFTLRVGERELTVQEVDGADPRLRLALAEVAENRHPELFPVGAPRVVGIVDRGGGAERLEPLQGALDTRIALRQAGMATTAAQISRASWLIVRGLIGVLGDRRLAVVGALFAGVIALSAFVFESGLGINLLNAFYFTVTTIMGVGYGDISLLEAEPATKLFGMAIMILGGLVLALVFAVLTDAIIGARLAHTLGQGPLPKRDHVVVCGTGKTGRRVIQALVETGVPCVGVDRDEAGPKRAHLRRLGAPSMVGDAASGETLDSLRLGSARALMAMTNDDLANLQCALLARARAPDLRVVLRLSDPDLAARIQRASNIQVSHSVFALAAPAFAAAILGHPATAVLPVGAKVLLVVGLTARQTIDVKALEHGCQARVLAVDGAEFPEPDAIIAPGANVIAVGTGSGLAELDLRIGSPGFDSATA